MWISLTTIMTLLWEKLSLSKLKMKATSNTVDVSGRPDQSLCLKWHHEKESFYLPNVSYTTCGCCLEMFLVWIFLFYAVLFI